MSVGEPEEEFDSVQPSWKVTQGPNGESLYVDESTQALYAFNESTRTHQRVNTVAQISMFEAAASGAPAEPVASSSEEEEVEEEGSDSEDNGVFDAVDDALAGDSDAEEDGGHGRSGTDQLLDLAQMETMADALSGPMDDDSSSSSDDSESDDLGGISADGKPKPSLKSRVRSETLHWEEYGVIEQERIREVINVTECRPRAALEALIANDWDSAAAIDRLTLVQSKRRQSVDESAVAAPATAEDGDADADADGDRDPSPLTESISVQTEQEQPKKSRVSVSVTGPKGVDPSSEMPSDPSAMDLSVYDGESWKKPLIIQFCSVTGLPQKDADKVLSKHRWNVNLAVNAYFRTGLSLTQDELHGMATRAIGVGTEDPDIEELRRDLNRKAAAMLLQNDTDEDRADLDDSDRESDIAPADYAMDSDGRRLDHLKKGSMELSRERLGYVQVKEESDEDNVEVVPLKSDSDARKVGFGGGRFGQFTDGVAPRGRHRQYDSYDQEQLAKILSNQQQVFDQEKQNLCTLVCALWNDRCSMLMELNDLGSDHSINEYQRADLRRKAGDQREGGDWSVLWPLLEKTCENVDVAAVIAKRKPLKNEGDSEDLLAVEDSVRGVGRHAPHQVSYGGIGALFPAELPPSEMDDAIADLESQGGSVPEITESEMALSAAAPASEVNVAALFGATDETRLDAADGLLGRSNDVDGDLDESESEVEDEDYEESSSGANNEDEDRQPRGRSGPSFGGVADLFSAVAPMEDSLADGFSSQQKSKKRDSQEMDDIEEEEDDSVSGAGEDPSQRTINGPPGATTVVSINLKKAKFSKDSDTEDDRSGDERELVDRVVDGDDGSEDDEEESSSSGVVVSGYRTPLRSSVKKGDHGDNEGHEREPSFALRDMFDSAASLSHRGSDDEGSIGERRRSSALNAGKHQPSGSRDSVSDGGSQYSGSESDYESGYSSSGGSRSSSRSPRRRHSSSDYDTGSEGSSDGFGIEMPDDDYFAISSFYGIADSGPSVNKRWDERKSFIQGDYGRVPGSGASSSSDEISKRRSSSNGTSKKKKSNHVPRGSSSGGLKFRSLQELGTPIGNDEKSSADSVVPASIPESEAAVGASGKHEKKETFSGLRVLYQDETDSEEDSAMLNNGGSHPSGLSAGGGSASVSSAQTTTDSPLDGDANEEYGDDVPSMPVFADSTPAKHRPSTAQRLGAAFDLISSLDSNENEVGTAESVGTEDTSTGDVGSSAADATADGARASSSSYSLRGGPSAGARESFKPASRMPMAQLEASAARASMMFGFTQREFPGIAEAPYSDSAADKAGRSSGVGTPATPLKTRTMARTVIQHPDNDGDGQAGSTDRSDLVDSAMMAAAAATVTGEHEFIAESQRRAEIEEALRPKIEAELRAVLTQEITKEVEQRLNEQNAQKMDSSAQKIREEVTVQVTADVTARFEAKIEELRREWLNERKAMAESKQRLAIESAKQMDSLRDIIQQQMQQFRQILTAVQGSHSKEEPQT